MCQLSPGAGTWLDVISDEVATEPGGAVVLVEHCGRDDGACLQPDAAHSLAAFAVYPAPDPATALKLFSFLRDSATLAIIDDGACGIDIFDLATNRWYSDAIASARWLRKGEPAKATGIAATAGFPANRSPPPPRSRLSGTGCRS
jgi:hypothetical protein